MDWITICITDKRLADPWGGGEYSPKFCTGRLLPKVQPLVFAVLSISSSFHIFRCFERFILCFTPFGDGSHCLNFD